MRRVLVILAPSLALAGCAGSNMNFNTDWFPKFEPAPVNIQFVSEPAGAEAKTSTGQACKTPCSIAMPADKEFSVSFSLAGYQTQTVPLQLTRPEGVETALQPNPVEVELVAAPKAPPTKKNPAPARKPATTASAPKPAAARPVAPPAAPAGSTDPWPTAR
jgi:hypothetical protein